MATQLSILQHNERNDTQYFRFYLQNASRGLIECSVQPDGWADGEVEYARSKEYRAVSRTISVSELTFVKEARDFIRDVYEAGGPIEKITFRVDYRKPDYTYWTYYEGKIDLFTYILDEISVKVSVIDTDFKSKVFTRDDVELNLLNTVAIDGEVLTGWDDETVTMPDTSIDRQSDFTDGSAGFITTTPHLVPMVEAVGSDFTETQGQTYGNALTAANGFFYNSGADRILNIVGSCDAEAIGDGSPHDYYFGLFVRVLNADGSLAADHGLNNNTITSDNPSFSLAFDKNITLYTGQSMLLCGEVDPVGASYKFSYTSLVLACNETFEGTPEHSTLGFPYYEAFLRLCQLITGQDNPFYSDFFGRTDTPFTTYASDGEIGFIVRGIYFRLPGEYWDEGFPFAITLKDLFTSMTNAFNLGLAVENIGGVDKVRVEAIDYFYDNTVVLDISSRIREEDIEVSCRADSFYKSIETGYNKFEYLAVEGLFEYNTKAIFTTSLINDKKLDLKSVFRADNQGMRTILKAPEDPDYEPSEDQKGDDEYFIVDALRSGGGFLARTDEGFTTVGGTIYADLSFNLLLTPARNLLRNGKQIKAGLLHSLTTYLKWQTSDKNTSLYTQLSTESAPLYENADILVDDLDDCRWKNETYKVSAYLTPAEKLLIDANMNGLIKLSATKYGWIDNLKTKNKDGKAEFQLIACNLDVVTPS
jgi:hypothetical protein